MDLIICIKVKRAMENKVLFFVRFLWVPIVNLIFDNF